MVALSYEERNLHRQTGQICQPPSLELYRIDFYQFPIQAGSGGRLEEGLDVNQDPKSPRFAAQADQAGL